MEASILLNANYQLPVCNIQENTNSTEEHISMVMSRVKGLRIVHENNCEFKPVKKFELTKPKLYVSFFYRKRWTEYPRILKKGYIVRHP